MQSKDIFRISATGSGTNYLPQFLAAELGFFETEQIQVAAEAPGHGPAVPRSVTEGRAEAGLGGIWRPLMYRGRLEPLVPFAQLCSRCPAVVIARHPIDDFDWTSYIGRTVIVPDGSPTPWILQEAVLRDAGITCTEVRVIREFLSAEGLDLFRAGLGDFFVTGSPTAELLVENGIGHIVADFADLAGPLPWSVYYATPTFLSDHLDLASRFARAILRALRWVREAEPTDAVSVVDRYFPDYPQSVIRAAVKRCKDSGMWADSVRIDAKSLSKWQTIIVSAGLLEEPVEYSEIVDDRPAVWAEQSLRSGM